MFREDDDSIPERNVSAGAYHVFGRRLHRVRERDGSRDSSGDGDRLYRDRANRSSDSRNVAALGEQTMTGSMPQPARERRRVVHYEFMAASVVTTPVGAEYSGTVSGIASELCQLGCFVQTEKPLPKGTEVEIEITFNGEMFAASGRVAHVTDYGMGILFTYVARLHQILLEKWLADETVR